MLKKAYSIADELNAIAEDQLKRIQDSMPNDEVTCFVLLFETTRIYDFLHFGGKHEITKHRISFQELDVIKYGWNLAVNLLFKSVRHFKGIPVMESTEETRKSAISILYQLGCTTLLKRTSDMVKSGVLEADKNDCQFSFSMSEEAKHQYHDAIEPKHLESLEEKINDLKRDSFNEWSLIDHDKLEFVSRSYGNFISRSENDPFDHLNIKDLKTKMSPLVKPWDSGKGIMMQYDSTEEIDWHFLAIARRAMNEWVFESGLHPALKLDGISMSDIIKVVTCLVSFNLKHVEFSRISLERHPEISIPQSLTIWCSQSQLITDIALFTNSDREVIVNVFEKISLKSEDSLYFQTHTTLFMPLLISLENDFVIRPVSSIIGNPLNTIKDLLALRNPKLVPEFTKDRENWLREYLYAMFMGTRYFKIHGNIKLRINQKDVTDIDAAIYDITTGELALFQIKWQDYHFNDVKKLRSKASNLTKELDSWTRKVIDWIESQGTNQLTRNLRLPKGIKLSTSKIYLFGLSKNAARMKGYGFEVSEPQIAVGTWPQFQRIRTEIGPSKKVFKDIFNALKSQESGEIKTNPMPVIFKVSEMEFHYKDLWCTENEIKENDD